MKKITLSLFITGLLCVSAVISNAQYIWTQKANFPGNTRYNAAGFSIGHFGYVGCGYGASGYYSDWWRWNQHTNTWSPIANYPGAGQLGCTYFSIGGSGYIGLGKNGVACQDDLWRYDTTTNAWTQMATFPGQARYGGRAFVIGTNAYICSGSPGGPPYLSDCWKYNSITNSWLQIASYPIPKFSTTITYSIGKYGYTGCGGDGTADNSYIFQYDTTANTWTEADSVPYSNGIAVQTYFVLNDTAYSVTGSNGLGEYLHHAYSYNSITNSWNVLPDFPGIPRINGVGFSIGNKGYVATGEDSSGGYQTDLWQYAPSNTTGINNIIETLSLNIFPNPAQNEIYIQLQGNAKAELIELYNITGKVVLKQKLTSQYSLLNTTEIPNGTYFLKVKMGDGSTEVKKVEILK